MELLCEDERDNRRNNSYKRRKAASKLPGNNRLEDFDFNYQPSIDSNQIYELGMCKFIKANENIVFVGYSGTGKTHLAISLGLKALEKEHRVHFAIVSDMLYNLHISKVDNSYHKKLQ